MIACFKDTPRKGIDHFGDMKFSPEGKILNEWKLVRNFLQKQSLFWHERAFLFARRDLLD